MEFLKDTPVLIAVLLVVSALLMLGLVLVMRIAVSIYFSQARELEAMKSEGQKRIVDGFRASVEALESHSKSTVASMDGLRREIAVISAAVAEHGAEMRGLQQFLELMHKDLFQLKDAMNKVLSFFHRKYPAKSETININDVDRLVRDKKDDE